jgi:hypothetical protein
MATRKLTLPQALYLTAAMKRPCTCYGSDYRVVGTLTAKGFLEEAGTSPLSHGTLYRPTRAGLEALLYDRKLDDWRSGSMATMERVRDVEAALEGVAA